MKKPSILSSPKYKYNSPEKTGFVKELRERVNDYFRKTGLSKRGGKEITFKTIFLFTLFIVSYSLMLSNFFSSIGILLLALLFGITSVLIVFCVAHDAGHQALFSNNKLNRIFSYSFNLLGASTYLWNITHNQIHHAYPNVGNYDTDIHQQAPLIRVSPAVPLKRYHHFQPYYATCLYMLYSIFLVFQKDYQDIGLLPKTDSLLLAKKKHLVKEYIILFASKIFYYTYAIIIP